MPSAETNKLTSLRRLVSELVCFYKVLGGTYPVVNENLSILSTQFFMFETVVRRRRRRGALSSAVDSYFRLDAALIRPGRADIKMFIGHCSAHQLERMFLRWVCNLIYSSTAVVKRRMMMLKVHEFMSLRYL